MDDRLPVRIAFDEGCGGTCEDPPEFPALVSDLGQIVAWMNEDEFGGETTAALGDRLAACYTACRDLADPAAVRSVLDDLAAACRTADGLLSNLMKAVDWGRTFDLDVAALNQSLLQLPGALRRYHALTGTGPEGPTHADS